MNKENSEMRGTVKHPFFRDREITLPTKGKLKWLGGNIGLDTPIEESVIDSEGRYLSMTLAEVLARIDEFEGERGGMATSKNLIRCAFDAYEYGLMNQTERMVFEEFVRQKVNHMDIFITAKKILTS